MKLLNPFDATFSGVHLVEASAGTGKTYNISSLYIRAIAEAGYSVDEILVVTYTNAATKELIDRLMKRIRESIQALEGKLSEGDAFLSNFSDNVHDKAIAIERLKKAIHSFDEASVYTIHGFCMQTLQEYAFYSGAPFRAELIGDDSEIIRDIVDDYWRKWVRDASQSEVKRPLLHFLTAQKNYTPDKLLDELGAFIGKPYLELKPEASSTESYYADVQILNQLFESLRTTWATEKNAIRSLLLSDPVSGRRFREGFLNNWMPQVEQWLQSEVTPLERCGKFSRFSQSYVNDSLKKSSIENGISPPQHPFFKQVDSFIALSDSLKQFETSFKHDVITHILAEIDEKKEELQAFSYDDVLIRLRNALHHPDRGKALQRSLRSAYPIALVDEFQDTDPIQNQIFQSIYAGHDETALFMIGDPKQSIYSFRGADIFAYLQAKKNVDSDKTFSLNHNYRTVKPLIEGLNTLFSLQENPFILKNISFEPVNAGRDMPLRLKIDQNEAVPLEIRQLRFNEDDGQLNKKSARERSAEDTAAQIHELLIAAAEGNATIGDQPVEAGDIAVLVRKNSQAQSVRDCLRVRGIKSVLRSKENVYQSTEAAELYHILKAITDPGNEWWIASALSSKLLGYTANELLNLQANEPAWASKIEQFSEWHDMWQQRGFAYMFRKIMQAENIAENVIRWQNGERILTNVVHLSELIMKKEKERQAGMHSLLKWLMKKRREDRRNQAEEEELRLESDENLVNVVTIHQSKGLEYPIVFCPFMWDVRQNTDNGSPLVYHDLENPSKTYLDLLGKQDPRRTEKRFQVAREDLAEEIRLSYVAATRAKYKCVINWVHANESTHSPLGFLLLGPRQAFGSLKASVGMEKSHSNDLIPLYRQAFQRLGEHDAIACPVISEIKRETKWIENPIEGTALKVRRFQRQVPLPPGPGMASFSSLVRNEQDDFESDFFSYYDEPFQNEAEKESSTSETIFDFPKGPGPGTAIHHIFENIDFTDDTGWNVVIKEQLGAQNIDQKWVPVARKMVADTIYKPLPGKQHPFQLASINAGQMMAEMEFYFTTGNLKLSEIIKIIRPDEDLPNMLDGFAETGFLKGFIDLVFEHEGSYYLMDYKTNYLGDTVENYIQRELKIEMKEALYDVQYHIYIIALHRFLKNRLKNYRYDDYLGGAFYLFVRGINTKGEQGIYFDRPDSQIIEELDRYINKKS